MRFSFYRCGGLALALAVFTGAVRAQTNGTNAPGVKETALSAPTGLREIPKISREQTESNITGLLPRLLEGLHYSQHPFDTEISRRFLDRYLDSLDHYHLYFLQTDLAQFEPYGTNLQTLTVRRHDYSPSTVIFSRFIQRVNERVAFATNLLRTGTFEFTNHERFIPNRHTLPYATNTDQAHDLWREELRYEYLDEKLKAPNMEVTGPASFDAQSNLVILLPLAYTNISSGKPSETVSNRSVETLLPRAFLDQQHQAFGSITPTASNLILQLRLSPAETRRNVTNNFYAPDGTRLGGIRFLHSADTAAAGDRKASTLLISAAISPEPDAAMHDRTPVIKPLDNPTNSPAQPESPTRPPAESLPVPRLTKAVVELDKKDTEEIAKSLTKRYTGLLKNYNDLTNDDYVLEAYLTALAHAFDPHSDYMGHASTENFNIQMKLSLSGIGAQLEQSADGDCQIKDLVPEGPAEKSGQITNEDIITAVAQADQGPVEVTGMPLLKIVGMIRGPKGTPVTLTILKAHPADPAARRETVTLVRDVIKLEDQGAKAKLFDLPESNGAPSARIGVVDLPSFYADMETDKAGDPPRYHPTTTKDVTQLLNRMKQEKVDGVILDLRRNGGGYLDQAISLTGLFGRGPVVQTREPDESPGSPGKIEVESTPKGTALYDGPLIVLISRYSASASEIVAGALQDYGRALIVGDKSTFGKGTVQSVVAISNYMSMGRIPYSYDPGSLKVTIKKFYRAGGSSTQSNGVAADIVIPSKLNYADVGESSLPNPMPWDDVSSADGLPNFNLVKPYLPELKKRSLARIETDKDFIYLKEEIDDYRKSLADLSVSLDETERLAEQTTNAARADVINKERASRPKSAEQVYEITMKNFGDSVLHPPTVAKRKPAPSIDDDPDSLDNVPDTADPAASDPALAEAKRIMADYISLLKKPLTAAATTKQP